MRISLIGTGRVAFHLAKVLSEHHQLVQIYGRNLDKLLSLSNQFGVHPIQNYADLDVTVDLMIIAVSDQAIQQVIQDLHTYAADTLIVHTSGSTHIQVLTDTHTRSGVFYPLQTFSVEREIDWQNTPLFVEAHHPHDAMLLKELAGSLSQRTYMYSSEQRLSLHLAAVFACNFSNYCYDMAKQIVDAKDVDFSLLYPLILETAHKAVQNDPRQMQTGPAMRGDQNILTMHRSMLGQSQRDDLAEVYALLSQQLLARHQSR
ncbi:F420-dependent NADP oxidoreductase [Acinetobacter sp. NCu2D-2]|uniref:Rossmann-like and DUF2520 domain-containing protein n=1 Tax=Acinetobacter sp. NCu2D-2 TaxID=1608473 RepID=UPI0007CDC8FB|nr:Rossmann-like and DUF2520 domain-containing protein [Acinetobacter sp. NCu2D-2]ANF81530.1 F420-dependent NADP oxidoreductase [Acinetobacter sp. NCu2D-2]